MTEQTFSDQAGANVRALREQNKWTRAELAARCARLGAPGLTAAAITNIELGKRDKQGVRHRDITVDEVIMLAAAFSVPPSVLLPDLGRGIGDLDIEFGVDDTIERLQELREFYRRLEDKAAKGIFGAGRFKRAD